MNYTKPIQFETYRKKELRVNLYINSVAMIFSLPQITSSSFPTEIEKLQQIELDMYILLTPNWRWLLNQYQAGKPSDQ